MQNTDLKELSWVRGESHLPSLLDEYRLPFQHGHSSEPAILTVYIALLKRKSIIWNQSTQSGSLLKTSYHSFLKPYAMEVTQNNHKKEGIE